MLRAGLARTHLLGFGGRTSEGRSSPLPLTPWEKDTSQTTLAQDLLVLRGEPLAGPQYTQDTTCHQNPSARF